MLNICTSAFGYGLASGVGLTLLVIGAVEIWSKNPQLRHKAAATIGGVTLMWVYIDLTFLH
jgi:hypothetical protein